jgi:DNA-binding SARP family transcriptional activator
MLEFRFLGQFSVRLDNQPVTIASRPAQSLLAFLAIHPEKDHRREKLAGMLWPDIAERDARRNLRQALWQIRKVLPDHTSNILRTNDLTIALIPTQAVWMDISLLEQKPEPDCPADQLVMAVAAYDGEFLPGFYDDWILIQREQFQVIYEHKIKLLLDHLLQLQQWEEILKWAEHWISQGQAPEPAYQALMLAYQGLGDSASARNVYRRCVEDLHRRLDLAPSEQTQHLYHTLSQEVAVLSTLEAGVPPSPIQGPALPLRSTPTYPNEKPPYVGSRPFTEQDANLFFGRETLAAELVQRLGITSLGNQERRGLENNLLILAGASGCGKTSFINAGLLPAARRRVQTAQEIKAAADLPDWQSFVFPLTAHPLKELAIHLTREAASVAATATLLDDLAGDWRSLDLFINKMLRSKKENAPAGILLIIDQFEQVFHACEDEAERRAFIENLLYAAAGEQVRIILVMRDEYLPHAMHQDNLRQAMESCLVHIPPISSEDLGRSIETPASQGGWVFQPGLVDLLLRDSGNEPGTLPFLQTALLETWNRRQDRSLTLSGYIQSGGIWGILAETASAVYQQLSAEQQRIARSILLQLTEYREGEGSICRCADPEELAAGEADAQAVQQVRQALTDARLIVTHQGSVELAHEALTREWHEFRQWLVEELAIKL